MWKSLLRRFSFVVMIAFSTEVLAQVPTITGFSPVSGDVGTTVIITGTNFSASLSGNTVFFGGVKANVTNASTTQLTVTVPIGATYQPISVLVNGLAAYSSVPFTVTFEGSGVWDATSFAAKVDLSASVNYGIAIGDLDGDGKLDLAVSSTLNVVSVYRNISTSGSLATGSFASRVDFPCGTNPHTPAIADLDGDGKPELMVVNYSDNTLSVFRNKSTAGSITLASFDTKIDFPAGNAPRNIAIGDLDNDGKPDVAIANSLGGNNVTILRNTSVSGGLTANSFANPVAFAAAGTPWSVAIGDLNGDGKSDLAVANGALGAGVTILQNIGTAGSLSTNSFSSPGVNIATGNNTFSVGIADLDGDGKLDIAAANTADNTVSILRNIGTTGGTLSATSFASKADFNTGSSPYTLAVGDLTGDGKPDLAVANNFSSGSISLFKNTSVSGSINAGSFTRVDFILSGNTPIFLRIGDIDGDGKEDLVSSNQSLNISILRNSIPTAAPTISTILPGSGPVGTTVTISGSDFSTVPSKNTVYFGATKASVVSCSSTQLAVTVPGGATYQPITVTSNGLTTYSAQPFVVSTPTAAITASSFSTNVDFTTGSYPVAFAIEDLDGDGKSDIVTSNNISNNISIFRSITSIGSISTNSFATKIDLLSGTGPIGVAVGDLDGDGKPDIVATNYTSNTFSAFINTSTPGAISFLAKLDFAASVNPYAVAIGDLDADGKPDVVVTNYGNGSGTNISVFKNTSQLGAVQFATNVDFLSVSAPNSLVIRDMNADGKPELIVGSPTNNFSVFNNTSTTGSINSSTFAAKVDFTTGPVNAIAVGDADGDGKPDVAVSTSGTSVLLFRNTSTTGAISIGSLSSSVSVITGSSPVASMGDIDGDGKIDLAITNRGNSTVSFFRNTSSSGTITYASGIDFATGPGPGNSLIGDLDGDGKPELITLNNTSQTTNTFSILRNQAVSLPPSITSFSPTSGAIGSSVTINGANFLNTPTGNVVYFGAVKATVTAASATQLTVTVPIGATYQPLSVLVNGLTAYSSQPFSVTFSSSGIIDANSFGANFDFTAGTQPYGLALADLDGDGKTDATVVNNGGVGAGTVSLFRNTSSLGVLGSGAFSTKADLSPSTNPHSVAIGDLDGDGKPDLVISNLSSNSVSVFKNISAAGTLTPASFATKVDFATNSAPRCVAIGDLDGDGKPDIATANNGSASLSILKNVGVQGVIDGSSFLAKVDLPIGNNPWSIAIGDIDGDGKLDLAIANQLSNTVSVMRNIGVVGSITTSSFSAKVDFITGTSPQGISIGDLDGDNKPDMAVANAQSNNISVFKNTSVAGTISFLGKSDFSGLGAPYTIAMGDLDGDGKPELATANNGGNSFSIFKNSTTLGTINSASFAKTDFNINTNSIYIAIADLDGDGRPDIATSDQSLGSLSVMRNQIGDPRIATFAPPAGAVGTTVTISGANFSTTPANNLVKFAGTTATVTASTATSITATVPVGAITGTITVTVGGLTATSASSFTVNTVSSPTIAGFSPTNGLIGATVSITGTNFDLTPANNIVKFNGTTAVVTGSTATNITTTVPTGATTGPITVTVGGQTATSASNFIVSAASTLVTLTETFVNTYNSGSTLEEFVTVNDATKVASTTIFYRGISEPSSALKSASVTASGNKFDKIFAATDLTDPIGLVYYFQVTDNASNVVVSKTGKAYVKYPANTATQVLPGLTPGVNASNYQIVSFPLTLTDNSVLSVFKDLAKQSTPPAYNKTLWRLYEYANGDNQEFGAFAGFTTIDPGKGYWLISRNNVTINPGEGTSVPIDDVTGAFNIPLASGWNLIGNPFSFSISWTDVLKFNGNPANIGNLETFSGGTISPNTDVLPKYQGGFVNNTTGGVFNLKIPATRNTALGGRAGQVHSVSNALDQPHWEVNLILSNGELTNKMGGIGMDTKATLIGKDALDETSVPLPPQIGMFELAYTHPESRIITTKEMVPTQSSFAWNFEIRRPDQTGDIQLTWDNTYFGDNSKQLILFDPVTFTITDMRSNNHVTLVPAVSKIRILYGEMNYIEQQLDNELPWLGSPYPNPAAGEATLPFRIPASHAQFPVAITIYNSQGIEVGRPVDQVLDRGQYSVKWTSTEPGLYLVRMRIGLEYATTVKVIFK